MPAVPASLPPAELFAAPAALLRVLLDVSLTAVNLLRPLYRPDPAAGIQDFAIEYLNPAAQRMVGLPEQPGGTLHSLFPETIATGVFDYYRRAYETATTDTFEVNYQADGIDNYFRLAARPCGELLVVSFTDTADQPRTAVEQTLRESQAAEKAARAETEAQRQRLHTILMQLPAHIATFHGPEHVYSLVSPAYQQLVAGRPLHGLAIRAALPELGGQEFFELLDHVYQTGQPRYAARFPATLNYDGTGRLQTRYFNVFLQALRNTQGDIDGVLNFAHDVTEQVQTTEQVQNLNQELAATNEELQVSNEELQANNAELARTEQELSALNQELEARVSARTQEAQAARAEAEQQPTRLERLFQQVPAAICILGGPELVYELANPAYQALAPGRPLLGKPLLEAVPEAADQPAYALTRRVYETGVPFAGQDLLIPVARAADGVLEERYFNVVQQPRYNEHGQIDGVLTFSFETTAQVHDRQRAEKLQAEVLAAARRQAQDREAFYQIFEHTPAAICIQRGPEHRYEYVNVAYQQLFPDRQLLGRPVAEALPEIVPAGILALLDGVYQTGETYFGQELPLLVAQPHGQPDRLMHFTFTYQAYRENGEIVGISTFAFEVSAQVQARHEADRQRQLLHTLFMEAPAPVVILDGPELVFQLVNPAYQLIFPGRELLGKPLLEALPELADSPIPGITRRVYETGETYVAQELPLLMARHEGAPLEEIIWTFTYQARRNLAGAVDGVLAFAFEVTEQVLARRRVEESESYFRRTADNVPAMIWVTNAQGQCTYLNAQWYAFTGQTEAQALGLGWTQAVHPDDAEAAGTTFMAASRQQAPFHILYRLRRHDGVYRWAVDSGLPRFGAGGEFEGIVGTVVDVHEQQLAEQALRRLTKKLRKARDEAQSLNAELQASNQRLVRTNVDLDNFIYTASHDLQAPITNIEGLLQALRSELPEQSPAGEVSYILDLMEGAVERFQRTLEHLTDVTKLQKEHGQPAEPVALAAVIEDVRLDLAPLLHQTRGRLEVDVRAIPTVLFAEKNLRSIVYNLLSNALKYHHPDRRPLVRVRGRREPGWQVLEVHDNGLGLDESQRQELFTMFRRLHSHVEGSGLGLYMVKRILENAGGRIEVQSQLGVGTTFTVFFPVEEPAGGAEQP